MSTEKKLQGIFLRYKPNRDLSCSKLFHNSLVPSRKMPSSQAGHIKTLKMCPCQHSTLIPIHSTRVTEADVQHASYLWAFEHMVHLPGKPSPRPLHLSTIKAQLRCPVLSVTSKGLGRRNSSIDGPLAVRAITDVLSWEGSNLGGTTKSITS